MKKSPRRVCRSARQARYALLADCARHVGASAIALRISVHDQAETILFRLTRGSGVAGLAGMARVAPYDDISLLRPLLDFARWSWKRSARAGRSFSVIRRMNTSSARARLRKLAPVLAARLGHALEPARGGARRCGPDALRRRDAGARCCAHVTRHASNSTPSP
ncbi:MAG: ATP-binding protein [Methylocystis sp.]